MLTTIELWVEQALNKDGVFVGLSVAALASTFVVAIGLYLEYERHELRIFGISKTTRLRPRRTSKFNRPARKKVGSFLVVGGVALEFIFGMTAFASAIIREEILQKQLIEVSPRAWIMTNEVKNRMADTLMPFADQKADLVVRTPEGEDPTEPANFAIAIRDVLATSRWLDPDGKRYVKNIFPNPSEPLFLHDVIQIGVMVQIRFPHATDKGKNAASALADALNREFPHSAFVLPDILEPPWPAWPSRDDDNTIVITVGSKRPWPNG